MLNFLSRRPSTEGEASQLPKPTASPGPSTVFRVTVPHDVAPGDEFQVYAGNRIVRVRCPLDSAPGQSLQITVPLNHGRPNLRSQNHQPQHQNSSQNVRRIADLPDGRAAYMVTVPEGVETGQRFPVRVDGQLLQVTCPDNVRPGMEVRISPTPPHSNSNVSRRSSAAESQTSPPSQLSAPIPADEKEQLFQVEVPDSVEPGQPFALLAQGVRVLVTCPANASPGQRIRFKLPMSLVQKTRSPEISLCYDKDGWKRTIRVTDTKFQWIRMDGRGDVDTTERFDVEKSAYVRNLELQRDCSSMRTGSLTFIPASEAVVDSKVKFTNSRDLVTCSEIASTQAKTFKEKLSWFEKVCSKLSIEWDAGHMQMNVRRRFLLDDSMHAVMGLTLQELRKVWRFEFIGEDGLDAGGLSREWFELVTQQLFDPYRGLWLNSSGNQMCMEINPASEFCCEDHLDYYRFLGRVMGKALLDRQLVSGHMVQHLYKQILGWPITFSDLEIADEEYFKSLKQLVAMAENGDDISMLCLDFTTTKEMMGMKEEVELVENGASIEVTNENLPEYIEASLKYRMLGRVKPQLTELLLGFFDVIPEPLLTVFDFQELELLMCGLPEIDMQDWKNHTDYTGEYEGTAGSNPACEWFWEVVEDYNQERKARLLQFVTGTSGVPARGFGALQSNDGNLRNFTIHGVKASVFRYPRAHTCFNRIDLPMYETKEELKEMLDLAVSMVAAGAATFDLE